MKKLILFLLLSQSLFAAIGRDSTTSASQASSTSPTLSSVVVGSHSDRLLLVAVQTRATALYENTACTFNTTESMTWFGSYAGPSNELVTLWYLRNPSVTTASVACTTTNANVGIIGAFSLYGVDLTIPFRSIKQTSGSGTTSSGTLTLDTVSGDLCLAFLFAGNNTSNVTNLVPGGSAAEEYDIVVQVATNARAGAASLTASGSTTAMSYTWTNNEAFAFMAVAIKPSPTPAAQVQRDSTAFAQYASASSFTLSATVASNSNKLLVVAVTNRSSSINNTTGCTFGGVALTKLTSINYAASGNGNTSVWYLKQPTASTANVVCSVTSASAATVSAHSFYNVDQTTTFRNTGTLAAASATTTGNLNLTTVAGDLCFTALLTGAGAVNVYRLRPAPDQVEEFELAYTGITTQVRANVSFYNAVGVSTNLSYSWANADVSALIGTAIIPYTATSTAPLMYYRKLLDN